MESTGFCKKEKDEDDDVIVLIDDENEEVGFLYAQLLGGCYDNMAISNQWIDFFNDAIREANKPMGQSMEDNHIFKAFMSNKLLFKPFASWPDCVHLGLNNVDAISNKLLYEITLRRGERLLWVSRHIANWKAKDNDEKTPSGCIITDQRKEKPLQIEVEKNALYPALGKPSDEAFEKWIREYKSGFAFPQINNSKRWVKMPFLE